MSLISLTDVVTDASLAIPLTVTRAKVKVASTGVGTRENSMFETTGIVNGISAVELERLPEAEQLKGGVKIASKFVFSAGGEGTTADIVTVQGVQYTVVSVDNGTMYGFTIAYCKLLSPREDLSGEGVVYETAENSQK